MFRDRFTAQDQEQSSQENLNTIMSETSQDSKPLMSDPSDHGMQTKVAGISLQERFERNPLTALKIEELPPSLISKLRTEPADFIPDHD